MAFKVNDSITWVGKVDWEIKKFHGEEYNTQKGTTYNSYLVRDEKTVLIDTVWGVYAKEFIANLRKEVDLKKIDYVVANHAEVDHSGSLGELMKLIPDVPIYCSVRGLKSIKGHFHKDWNFKPVKTGDKLSLGKKELVFVEMAMLHWPDSMMCYLTGDNALFSNDAFGQHLATELKYNDLVNQAELFHEAVKYYANILTPFSRFVVDKINEVLALKLSVSMILPSHGVLWRKNPLQIVETYMKWAQDYKENQITIIYDTMWNGTRAMAEAIAAGIRQEDQSVEIKLYNVARSDKTEVIADVFKAKTILVGSPTINKGILSAMAATMEMIEGLKFQKKKAAAFGCYGWSGESVKVLTEKLQKAGFEIFDEGVKGYWNPDEADLAKAVELGRKAAKA